MYRLGFKAKDQYSQRSGVATNEVVLGTSGRAVGLMPVALSWIWMFTVVLGIGSLAPNEVLSGASLRWTLLFLPLLKHIWLELLSQERLLDNLVTAGPPNTMSRVRTFSKAPSRCIADRLDDSSYRADREH